MRARPLARARMRTRPLARARARARARVRASGHPNFGFPLLGLDPRACSLTLLARHSVWRYVRKVAVSAIETVGEPPLAPATARLAPEYSGGGPGPTMQATRPETPSPATEPRPAGPEFSSADCAGHPLRSLAYAIWTTL